jgi:predicted naringenin-chalcone synthase
MAAYPLQSFDEATRVFLEVGTDLAERAMGPGFSSELVLLRQAGGG